MGKSKQQNAAPAPAPAPAPAKTATLVNLVLTRAARITVDGVHLRRGPGYKFQAEKIYADFLIEHNFARLG